MPSFDRDRLGLGIAAFISTLVMAVSFYRQVTVAEVATRAGLIFVGAYAAVFIFVLTVQRVLVTEATLQKRRHAAQSASAAAPTAEAPSADTGERGA